MAIRTILGYDIEEGVDPEEYERWLFDIHIPDILANPFVDRLSFNKVLRPVAQASDGSPITKEGLSFYRIAEMEFADEDAYRSYIEWFAEHPVPSERGPKGRTKFKFYLVTESTIADRTQGYPPSFLDLASESE